MIDVLRPGLGFLENTLVFILSLGLMVFFHELGHFLVAKACSVRVLTFSIGMGRKLWRYQPGETEYTISAIPFGGYVKMAGEGQGDGGEQDERSFAAKGVGARALIILAGPAMNIVLALLIHFGLSLAVGIPAPRPVAIFAVQEGSAAAEAGLQEGDRILRMNGDEVGSPADVVVAVLSTPRDHAVHLSLGRGGQVIDKEVVPRFDPEADKHLLGISTEGIQEPILGSVKDGGDAERAGLQPGDRLLAVAGSPVSVWREVQEALNASIGQEIEIVAERAGERLRVALTPQPHRLAGELPDGSVFADVGIIFQEPRQPASLPQAVLAGWEETWADAGFLVQSLVLIVSSKVGRESVAGPVGIASVIAESYAYGIDRLLRLVALISVNLAVVNLLPFPVLDGGQLVFVGIETVARRPLSERVMMVANQVGLVVLLLLFVFLTLNDLDRIIPVSIFGG